MASARLHLVPAITTLVALGVAFSANARPGTTITFASSGGSPDCSYLTGPESVPLAAPFTASTFDSANHPFNSPIAIAPNPAWISSIPGSPAVWVNPTSTGSSALYCFRFTVPSLPTGPVPSAILTLRYAVDNQLGGGPNVGVYLNEQPIPCIVPAGGFSSVTTHTCNVMPLLTTGVNRLYINQANLGGPSGLLLDAKLQLFSSVIEVPGDAATLQEAHDLAITGQTVLVTAPDIAPANTIWNKRVHLRGQNPGGLHRIRYSGAFFPIFAAGSNFTEVSDLVFDREAGAPGLSGVIVNSVSPITFDRVQFNNMNPSGGWSLVAAQSSVQLRNCVFLSGPAVSGPLQLNAEGSSADINACTFLGGQNAIAVGDLNMNINVRNSIMHVPGGTPLPSPSLHTISVQHSLVTGGFAGAGNLAGDPRLIAGTFIPSPLSPCIDAGNNMSVPAGSDFIGNTRLTRGRLSSPQAAIDMGAVESLPPACAGDNNGDGLVNGADLSVLLARFGQACQ